MCCALSFRFSSAFYIPIYNVTEIVSVPIIYWLSAMDNKNGPANIPNTLPISALSIFTMIYMTDTIITHICTLEKDIDNCASCPRLHSNDGYKLWSQDLNLNSLAQEFLLTVSLILASPSHPSSLSLLFFSESWILNLVLYAF